MSAPAPAFASGRSLRSITLVAVALTTLPALLGGLVWDDAVLVEENPFADGSEPLWRSLVEPLYHEGGLEAYYRPLLSFSLAALGHVFGPRPLPFHLLGWCLHLLATALCMRWLRMRVSSPTDDDPRALALAVCLGAATFGLHPARAQSAVWISGLGDAYLAVFGLLAALALEGTRTGPLRAVAFAASCTAALASKEAGIAVLPWLCIDHGLRGGWRALRARALPLGLGALGVAALLVGRALVVEPDTSLWVGGPGGLVSRVLVSLGFDLKALVWPFDMRVQLNYPLHDWTHLPLGIAWLALPGLLALVGGAVLAALAWRRAKLRPWTADVLTVLVLLGPTLNVAVIGGRGGTLSERYLTLPSIGAAALVARGLVTLGGRARAWATGLALAGCLVCAALLAREVRHFESERALFTHFAAQDPDDLATLTRLQGIDLRAGRLLEARAWAVRRAHVVADPPEPPTWADEPPPEPDDVTKATGLIVFVDVELRALSDTEQARLKEIRTLLDGLATADHTRVSLTVGGESIGVEASDALREKLREAEQLDGLTKLRSRVHARTFDLEGARRIAEALPRGPREDGLRTQLALWAGDYAAAGALMADLPPAHRQHWSTARQRLANAPNPLAQALELARAGWPAGARAELDALGLPPHHPARAEIDLLDGRPDLALARLEGFDQAPGAHEVRARARAQLARGLGLRRVVPPF